MTHVTSITPDTVLHAPLLLMKESSFKLRATDKDVCTQCPSGLFSGKMGPPPFDFSTYNNKLRSPEGADLLHCVKFSSIKTPPVLGIRTHTSQQAEPELKHSH